MKLFGLVTGTETKPRLSGVHGTKYQNMCKWILEILIKFENRGIKIFLVLELIIFSILITKSKHLQLFIFNSYFVGGPL